MRFLLKFVVAVVVVLVLGAVAVFIYANTITRRAIEQSATRAFGVETTVQSASAGLITGEFDATTINVHNPPKFGPAHFVLIDRAEASLEWSSLLDDTVRLPHLTISGVDMHLSRKGNESNYQIILGNLRGHEDEPKAAGRKYVIDTLKITDVVAHVSIAPVDLSILGGEDLTKLDVNIDEIVLNDVGTHTDGGVVMSEVTGVVLKAVVAAVIDKAGGILPPEVTGDLREQLSKLQGIEQIANIKDLGGLVDVLTGSGAKKDGAKSKDKLPDAIRDARKALEGLTDDKKPK